MKDEILREILTCTECGYCKQVCPIYDVVGWETFSPRGRINLTYGFLLEALKYTEKAGSALFSCLGCGVGEIRCPSKIRIRKIMFRGKQEALKRGAKPTKKQAELLENVLKAKNIYGKKLPERKVSKDVVFFSGCIIPLEEESVHKSVLKLVSEFLPGAEVLDGICCGRPLLALGEVEKFRSYAEELARELQDREVVVACPSCYEALKTWYQEEAGISLNVKHLLEYVDDGRLAKSLSSKVVVHDPCSLRREPDVLRKCRSLLESLGAKVVEPSKKFEWTLCCGSGHKLMSEEELGRRVSEKRGEDLVKTGADVVVTICPECARMLKASLQPKVKVVDVYTLLSGAVA